MRTNTNRSAFCLKLVTATAALLAGAVGCSDSASTQSVGSSAGTTSLSGTGGVIATAGAGGLLSSGGSSSMAGTGGVGGTSQQQQSGASGAGGSAVGGAGNAAGGMAGAAGTGGASNEPPGPPMGWASWNSFAANINLEVIKAQADAMVSSRLQATGYEYVNIDEGWWQGTRDGSGNITIDETEWPGGMKAAADYIHALGLKAGIYTDAGKDGCGFYYPTGRPAAPGSGSEGHYEQDFLQFSKWGFDFVKVDWCGGSGEGLDAKTAYQAISDAIEKATSETGRPMLLSVCNWGEQNPWDWAPALSRMWRTSQDIINYGEDADIHRVLSNFDSAQHPTAQSPGHYNDPDMLVIGMPGFDLAQNRTHMALWAISGAPLMAGNRLDSTSAETKGVLTNSEVIAIDQDPLAQQGTKVSDDGGRQVYSKVLAGVGRRAVLLLNRSTSTAMLTVRFADIGLGASAAVRDVWGASELGVKTTSYADSVNSNDSLLLLVTDPTAQ